MGGLASRSRPKGITSVAGTVVLTGGGVQGAVAAALVAAQHELFLVHVDYGQGCAGAEFNAVEALAGSLSSARAVSLRMPHLKALQGLPEAVNPTGRSTRGRGRAGSEALSPASLRGLIPLLVTVGVQCGARLGTTVVVTGLSRFCNAVHLGVLESDGKLDRLHEFLHSFEIMLESLSARGPAVRIEAPLADLSYPQVLKLAERLAVPLEHTWTCERAGPRVCERCSPCNARRSAFLEAALVDPLALEAPTPA